MKHDYITPAERLADTPAAKPLTPDEQQARFERERLRALEWLGRRWLLHPANAPRPKLLRRKAL
jgi:hypothetical protein